MSIRKPLFAVLIFLVAFAGCTLQGEDTMKEPTVNTVAVTAITSTTAKSGGEVEKDGGSAVMSRGLCWSENPSPTITDHFVESGNGTGSFEATMTDLVPGETYHVRAYATNTFGVGYGEEFEFTTRTDLTNIEITTVFESIPKGFTVEFKAEGTYSDNTKVDITDQVSWTTENADILSNVNTSVDNIFLGTGEGTTNVFAVLGDVSTVYPFTVTEKIIQSIVINTESTEIMPGSTQTVLVTGKFSDQSEEDVTSSIVWSSTNPDVATVEGDLMTTVISAHDFGTTEIAAVYDALVTTIDITVKVILGEEYTGGIVFYIDESGEHGLVAAKEDQSEGIVFWVGTWTYVDMPSYTPDESVGAGKTNTETQVNTQGAGNYAAKLCADLELEGYDDWFLPSKDELVLMCQNLYKEGIGGLSDNFYWSSTDVNRIHNATWMQFSGGCQVRTDLGRNMENRVRAVRVF